MLVDAQVGDEDQGLGIDVSWPSNHALHRSRMSARSYLVAFAVFFARDSRLLKNREMVPNAT